MHVGATLRWPLRIAQLRVLKNVRRRPTLPQPLGCSTIGAERLNFRVRDGTGCFPFAMAAVTLAVDSPVGVLSPWVSSKLFVQLDNTVCVVLYWCSGREHVVVRLRGFFVVLVEGLCDKPSAY